MEFGWDSYWASNGTGMEIFIGYRMAIEMMNGIEMRISIGDWC